MFRNFKNFVIMICCLVGLILVGCKKEDNGNGDGQLFILLVNGIDVYEDIFKASVGQLMELFYSIEDDQNSYMFSMFKFNGVVVRFVDFIFNNVCIEDVLKAGILIL